jgi:hypothetical protein
MSQKKTDTPAKLKFENASPSPCGLFGFKRIGEVNVWRQVFGTELHVVDILDIYLGGWILTTIGVYAVGWRLNDSLCIGTSSTLGQHGGGRRLAAVDCRPY